MRSILAPKFSAALALVLVLAGCSAAPLANPADSLGSASDSSGLSGSISIAAAASLEPAFRELADRFTAETPGVTIENMSFDGSSTLAVQIIGGAPFDVFASADENNMAKVEDQGLTDGASTAFATNRLELAVLPGNPLNIESLADLKRADVLTVMCAPEVPCGAAAHQLLDSAGVVIAPVSEEQNVTAVLTKVVEGEADAGLIYRSDVKRSEGRVIGLEIPGSMAAAGTYMVAPLKDARSADAARAFAEYLLSSEAQELFKKLGFGAV